MLPKKVVLKLQRRKEIPGEFITQNSGHHPQSFQFSKILISKKFPGDVDALIQEPHLENHCMQLLDSKVTVSVQW